MVKGATYSWYVKTDKGNPDAVEINKKTGVVTAKEAGTAYIRCKVTLTDGTVFRPEAKVTVRNNITEVEINNLPANLTITAGSATDFNRTILDTDAGKGVKTLGITRFEIKEDTAGVETATTQGIVFPVKEGKFRIRAVCFQSTAKYKLWLADKEANKTCITAASEWAAIKVISANGMATASTQEQLNKLLKADNITQITLSTEKAVTFAIPEGDYSSKNLIVNAANADVENHGIFKDITINAIKDSTWIEYANGNIVYLKDDAAGFVIDKDVDVKRIVIDRADSTLNIEINGTVEQIIVLQPSELNITGSGKQIPVSVEQAAGGSTITSSMPLDLELKAKTDLVLNQGAEETVINKSVSDVVVKIENNTKKDGTITTNKSGGEAIGTGKTVISGGTSTAANPSTGPSSGPSTGPSTIAVNGITVTSAGAAATIAYGSTLQMSAAVVPANATNKTVTWSVINGTGSATINADGLLNPTGVGTVTVKAVANDGSLKEGTKEITITVAVLAQVANAVLGADGAATWNNVSNEASYDIQLLKGGVNIGAVVNVTADTLTTNLLTAMRAGGAGIYTFTVTAKGDGVYYLNGAVSAASAAQTIIQLAAVSAGLNWTGNVAHWTAIANAVSYDVQLYKGGVATESPVNVSAGNAAAGADFSAAITAAGSGTYTYKVTAKGNTTMILDAAASAASDNNIKAAALAQVTNAVLGADGAATWNNVSNETSYDIQLLKGGVNIGAVVNVTADTLTTNLLTAMRAGGAGIYTFTVTAKGDGVYYSNGAASAASTARTIIQLPAVSAGLNWTGNVAHWTAVDNAVSYDVQLYKDGAATGSPANVSAGNAAAGADFSAAITTAGAGTYTYKVTAKGNTTLILDAAASAASDNNIKAAALAQVTNAVLGADGAATWNNVSNEASYDIQLLKGGVNIGAVVNVTADTLTTNLLTAMRAGGAGIYTFTVTAKGDGVYYSNGAASAASTARTIIQLPAVNAGLNWTGNVGHWTAVDNAVSYDVQLYKDGVATGAALNVSAGNAAAGADFSAAITAVGAGTYTYKVTAKGNTTLILDAAASAASDNNIKAAALAQVTNAVLGADGAATWNNVSNEASYDIQLLKGGVNIGTVVNVTADTLTTNLLTAMRAGGAGIYTFTVTAKGDGVYYSNGAVSAASAAQTIIQLPAVSAGITWTGNVAHWTTVTNAVSYDVQLYKGGVATGSAINVLPDNAAAGADFSAAITTAGPGTYTYRVTAKGNTTLILDAAVSAASNNNIKATVLAQVTNAVLGTNGVATWSDVSYETSYDIQLFKGGVKQGAVVSVTANTLSTNLLATMRAVGTGEYTVTVTAKGDGVNYTNGAASNASAAQTIIQLEAVSAGLNWSGDTAHWTTVANAVSYDIQLYKGGVATGSPINVLAYNAAAGKDFSTAITAAGAGTYTYKVTAKGNATLILDAAASVVSDNNIKIVAPLITGYVVAPGTVVGSTKITYTVGTGNKLRYRKYSSDAIIVTPMVGEIDTYDPLYASGENILSVNASEQIALYELETATNKVVKFVVIRLGAGDIATQIAGTASDSTVMMQENNMTVTAGDVFEFTLSKGTLKAQAVIAALDPKDVISFSTLPAGMTYTVANVGDKLVVTFNNPTTVAIGADVQMNAVIKAAAVTDVGIWDSENISVTLKNHIYTSGYYTYTLNGTNATIIGCTDPSQNITIPSLLDGKTVVGIGSGVFYNKTLTSVILPASITSIGTSAFNGSGLTTLTIPNNVTIASFAFINNALTTIIIGTGVTIEDNMLDGSGNNYFRIAYNSGHAGTYHGTQGGVWSK